MNEQNESMTASPFNLSRAGSQRKSVGGGILNGDMLTASDNSTHEKGAWDTAMDWGKQAGDWAKEAGKRLSRAEEEIWRKANGKY
jgi:hypothetical protein